MRIATWNVNSLNARMERVEEWLHYAQPDVVCLQETKCKEEAFPYMHFQTLGYEAVHHGAGRWNGVAILSRVGLEDVVNGFTDDIEDEEIESRAIWATCGDIRVASLYVPNGRSLDDPHYEYKLHWLERLHSMLIKSCDPNKPLVLAGDFNIAPADLDVWNPKKFTNATHVSQRERDALQALLDWGMTDSFRYLYPEDQVFSWWDYRSGDFHQGRGMRIDLMLASHCMENRLKYCLIDRNARKGKQPSDHAPMLLDIGE